MSGEHAPKRLSPDELREIERRCRTRSAGLYRVAGQREFLQVLSTALRNKDELAIKKLFGWHQDKHLTGEALLEKVRIHVCEMLGVTLPKADPVDYDKIAHVVRLALNEQRPPDALRVGIREIIRRFNISRSTVIRYMEAGDIPFEKVSGKLLFEPSAVDQALKKRRRNAIGD